ncbi:MAG: DNA-3-methyladenine glycosylase family protein [Streptosporangiaceae bacterium]
MSTMVTVSLTPRGPFSLAASTRFLEGFAPADHPGRLTADDPLPLAFPVAGDWRTVGAAVRQEPDGTVVAEVTGGADLAAVRAQLARVLSLDVDGGGFRGVANADPVVGSLVQRYPGLRPVCFYSPYEAAAWAVIGHRVRIVQAARIKSRIAERYGDRVTVAGVSMSAFPAPDALRAADPIPALPAVKVTRLHRIAEAALAGDLDGDRLRSLPVEEALEHLRLLPGIGPFSAELILIRGAGHPDVFPQHERRLHASMAEAYRLDRPALARLAEIAAGWVPYRSWVALLFRTHREETTGEIARGRPARQ